MMVKQKVLSLKSEIKKYILVFQRIVEFYNNFITNEFLPEHRKTEHAIIISDLICNSYTCLETCFFRISQFFENDLNRDKWHQDLLKKMMIEIDEIRPAVIREETYVNLLEILKFRHFKRYYFELDYDWDKLEFVQKKYQQAVPLVSEDLENFIEFLGKLV